MRGRRRDLGNRNWTLVRLQALLATLTLERLLLRRLPTQLSLLAQLSQAGCKHWETPQRPPGFDCVWPDAPC